MTTIDVTTTDPLMDQRGVDRSAWGWPIFRRSTPQRRSYTDRNRADSRALPMVQAIMLLGIYALPPPLVVVLSRYSIAMMVVGGMAIFTIKCWTVLCYLAMWVDQNLILSMYSDVNVFLQIFVNPGEHDAKRIACC